MARPLWISPSLLKESHIDFARERNEQGGSHGPKYLHRVRICNSEKSPRSDEDRNYGMCILYTIPTVLFNEYCKRTQNAFFPWMGYVCIRSKNVVKCSMKRKFLQLSWLAGSEEIRSVKLAHIPDTNLSTSTDPDTEEKNKDPYISFVADEK